MNVKRERQSHNDHWLWANENSVCVRDNRTFWTKIRAHFNWHTYTHILTCPKRIPRWSSNSVHLYFALRSVCICVCAISSFSLHARMYTATYGMCYLIDWACLAAEKNVHIDFSSSCLRMYCTSPVSCACMRVCSVHPSPIVWVACISAIFLPYVWNARVSVCKRGLNVNIAQWVFYDIVVTAFNDIFFGWKREIKKTSTTIDNFLVIPMVVVCKSFDIRI